MKFIYLLNLFDWIGENIINGIAGFFFHILLWLDSAIYSFISYIYNIFLLLAGGGSIFNNNQVSALVSRIYTIIGVVVLFLAAYSLLKSMVNPDEALKGKKSPINIIKDVVISIVLIAFIPTIFDFAFEFQNSLLVENTIGKIIAGSPTNSSENAETIRMGGYNMAAGVLQAFIYVNPDGDENGTPYCRTQEEEGKLALIPEGKTCTPLYVNGSNSYTYGDLWKSAHDNTTFTNLTALAPLISEGKVNYIFLLDAVAGVFVLFVLLQYCLDMALRLVKLAVYELIAPLPILARIMPNEQAGKVFTNWTKATLSTFVEVFIRIAILYFAVILISSVGDSLLTLFGSGALNFNNDEALFLTKSIAHALIIIGIILFIKQAPEIIKEITGLDGGKYGKSLIKGVGMMAATVGGGATAAIRTMANDTDNKWVKGGNLGKNIANKFKQVGKGALAGASNTGRGLWQGSKADKIGDVPKVAGKAASNTLEHRAKVKAAGGNLRYLNEWRKDKIKDVKGWASGSFEVQQKMLDQINEFVKDTKSVKSTSEGYVRDKKYLFKYGKDLDDEEMNRIGYKRDASGNLVLRADINKDTTLDQMEAMIQSLKSSGDVEDAKAAAAIESMMNKQIKTIGQEIVSVSLDRDKASDFDTKYFTSSKGIIKEGIVTLDQTKSAFEIVKQRYDANGSLDAVKNFKLDPEGGTLKTDNVSNLTNYLESQASNIQQNIKLEQERRKANEKK